MKIFTTINQFNKIYFPRDYKKHKEDLIIKNMTTKELVEYNLSKLFKKITKI